MSCTSTVDQRGRIALPAFSTNPPGEENANGAPLPPVSPDPHETSSMAAQGITTVKAMRPKRHTMRQPHFRRRDSLVIEREKCCARGERTIPPPGNEGAKKRDSLCKKSVKTGSMKRK